MRALVIYESMFGNTAAVAKAIVTGLADGIDVEIFEVSSAPAAVDERFDLIVVGGPTHAFGLSRESTRQSAVDQGAPGPKVRTGIRDWLQSLHLEPDVRLGAAFATRIPKKWIPGSAARSAARVLEQRGVRLLLPAEDFFVEDVAGPLLPRELERAEQWGRELRTALAAASDRAAS